MKKICVTLLLCVALLSSTVENVTLASSTSDASSIVINNRVDNTMSYAASRITVSTAGAKSKGPILEDVVAPEDIASPTVEPKPLNPATAHFGQKVSIREGVAYFASADLAGSGASAKTFNSYTEGQLYLGGFAATAGKRLVDFKAYLRDNIPQGRPAPDFCRNASGDLWCFVVTDGFTDGSIGWFLSKDVFCAQPDTNHPDISTEKLEISDIMPSESTVEASMGIEPGPEPAKDIMKEDDAWEQTDTPSHPASVFEDRSETTSDQVASNIEELATAGEKVAVLLDASGSVSSYSADIASYAEQVNTADTIIMFSATSKVITADTYAEESDKLAWDASSTNLFAALNSFPGEEYDTVILVSDLCAHDSGLYERTDIENVVIIYVGELNDELMDWEQRVVDEITEKWGVTPVIQQLVAE